MERLSPATWEKIQQVFSPEHQADAASTLVNECGNNLPFCKNKDQYGLERIRFAVLKLSDGDMGTLRYWVDIAKVDWRDVLMAAGFGHSPTAHKEWR
jgi:hypothetical protein